MVVKLEPEKMSKEELKEAHRKYDSVAVKKKLYEKYNYSDRQLMAIKRGEL